jgi:arylsulfatase A-like enzyme
VLISGEDLAPTFLQAAGVVVPERMSGVSFLPLLKGEAFEQEREFVFAERGPHGGATFTLQTLASSVDYSRCVRDTRYKLIYNVTPHQRYAPVDSAGDLGWQAIQRAQQDGSLAEAWVKKWFTLPRPVYELYDLEQDPHEMENLYGRKELAEVAERLKGALQKKMILDSDYLPLPIAAAKKKSQASEQGVQSRLQMFKKLDQNGDGSLGFGEFGNNRNESDARGWFEARDVNRDGKLDEKEYTASQVANPPKKQ